MAFDPEKHHRRSIRLKGYDYAQAGAYFVTICAYRRECLFGQVENGVVVLSQYGRLVEQCWQVLPRDFPRVELDAFVIMPNHLHGIIVLTGCLTAGRGEAFAQRFQEESRSTSANASPLRLAHGTQPGSLAAIVQNFQEESRSTPANALPLRSAHGTQPGSLAAIVQNFQEQPRSTPANALPLRSAHGTQPGSLAAIVQNFKSVSTRKINRMRATPGMPVWQGNYHEHIIRDEAELSCIREYIVNNPLQWALDRENPLVGVSHAPSLLKDDPWRV
ncbi:MAG: hypothetical protein HY268_27290 [Deltaproteobacteria bacterium]|nr:hypothetical protein [Deltaproteobacteria bacterium]